VIDELQKQRHEVIFPSPSGNPLFTAVSGGGKIGEQASRPSLPNRAAALVKAQDSESLKIELNEIKEKVIKELVELFRQAERQLTRYDTISEDHVRDFFELYYAFCPYDHMKHGESLKTAEELLAARKNVRDFKPFPQKGYKCTQCGIREPFRRNADDWKKIDDLRTYWAELSKKNHLGYVLKGNERLCPICAGKRLLRRSSPNIEGGAIPSTSTIAVAQWLHQTLVPSVDSEKAKEFVNKLKKAHLYIEAGRVPRNAREAHPLYDVEGDCLMADSYDRFERDPDLEAHKDNVRLARAYLTDEILKSSPAPPRYFAILALDGDSIGKRSRQFSNKKGHLDFSGSLSEFTQAVYQTIANHYHGYVVYSGGDEGVVLLPLIEIFNAMEKLRTLFRQKTNCNLSIGAAIVHHQAPLGQGLRAAEIALRMAKEVKNKNAFSFNVRIRSGAHSMCTAPWEVSGQCMMDVLNIWLEHYREKELSQRWYYLFALIGPSVIDSQGRWSPSLVINELFRILPRHMPDTDAALSLASETSDIITADANIGNFENLLSLLRVPLFVHRGG
jgi:hypothetical protein